MARQGRHDIAQRFALRCQAERYRDRFHRGRHRRTHEREVAALHRLLSTLGRLDTILDVASASGAGRLAPVFVNHARTLLHTDISFEMLSISRERCDLPGIRGHIQADARMLPLATNSVDLVFCHRLLNHVPGQEDRLQIMAHLARVSRRFVTISCLTPPAPLRAFRRVYARLRGRSPIDGSVEVADLLQDAEQVGLRLVKRTAIRFGIGSAAFVTFAKVGGA